MHHFRIDRLAALLLFVALNHAAIAEDYWSYSYQGFDVVTTIGSDHTVTLAHHLARFDAALTRILALSERRVRTHIYVLRGKELEALLGKVAASYSFSGYEVRVITTNAGPDPDWGPLFGYTGSLLVSGRVIRAPYWYRIGVPQVFAQTEFEVGSVKTGGIAPGFLHMVLHSKLIPMRVFLAMQASDPQLRGTSGYRDLFDAESWYLAHEIYVEGKLRPEFFHYIGLMRQGQSEADAFTASFKISYEELDKVLMEALRDQPHQFVVKIPPEPKDEQAPRKLSPIEAKAVLAELNLVTNHRAEALRLATEALEADPKSELSLSVLARANLADGNFSASLAAVDKLAVVPGPSAAALAESGDVLSGLARAVSAQHASIGASGEALSARAKEAYEGAIHLDPDELRAWSGLAYLYRSSRDGVAARALATRAQPVMEKHLDNGALARALATMSEQTGLRDSAFLFGEYWRDDAISPGDLDEARAFMVRMGAH